MRAVVVYESMFGNTEAVARAVAEGLSGHLPVDVVEVAQAPTSFDPRVGLLVVGAPTHAFGLSRPATRQDAAAPRGGPVHQLVSSHGGVREWLAQLSSGTAEVAVFDTHVDALLHGAASAPAARRLRRLGFRTGERRGFVVAGREGPLVPGELDRARAWGQALGARVAARTAAAQGR